MRHRIYRILVLATAIGMCQQTFADRRNQMDEPTLKEASALTRIDIDGTKTPELVPEAVRMKIFFYRYSRYRSALLKSISAADEALLNAYSEVHAQTVADDERKRRAVYQEIAARAPSMTPLDLAVAFESAYQRSQSLANERYNALLNQLSAQGRQAVNEFAYEHIRPNMVLSNQIEIARRSPEAYKAAVLESYQTLRPQHLETTEGDSTAAERARDDEKPSRSPASSPRFSF